MALQSYSAAPTGGTSGAIVPVGSAHELSEEEYQKRLEDAAKLEEQLKFITEKVPTRIMNVAGSNAGAGSGEFHMYRMARRRELMRQQRIEEGAREREEQEAFEAKRKAMQSLEEQRTSKRRAKRLKAKEKKQRAKGDDAAPEPFRLPNQNSGSGSDDGAPAQPCLD